MMKFKAHMLMVSTQIGYALLYFITEAFFNHGMNPHVYVTYRHIVAAIAMFPFAYFLESSKLLNEDNYDGRVLQRLRDLT
ncbi:hypothetical protein K1719_009323 [Acacia pycnantha]|nr:hypothetical protein K1719_009323 [Acacia pycnantha]